MKYVGGQEDPMQNLWADNETVLKFVGRHWNPIEIFVDGQGNSTEIYGDIEILLNLVDRNGWTLLEGAALARGRCSKKGKKKRKREKEKKKE